MATPTLVQHYYTGAMSQPASGLTTVDMKLFLPNRALAGNCLVLFVDYDSGVSVSSVTDDQGNTWAAASATADGGAGNAKSSVFVRPNCSVDTQWIRIKFGAATNGFHAVVLEYANLASSSVVAQTKTSITPTSPTIATGSFSSSPTLGNLILHYAVDNVGQIGGQACNNVSAWAHGTSFTMLGGDVNNIKTMSPFGLQTRLADGSALNPTMTATQVTHDTFNTIAVELTAGSSGAVPSGIRIRKWQTFVGPLLANTLWTEFYPHTDNSVLVMITTQDSTNQLNTDSESNTWQWDFQSGDLPRFQSIQFASANDAYTVTFKSGNNSNDTWVFVELTGVKTGARVGGTGSKESVTASTDTNIPHAPDMTCQGGSQGNGARNSLILTVCPIGHGPVPALLPPTPSNALFVGVLYPEETDFDTMVNATSYSALYPIAPTGLSWNWQWNVAPWTVGTPESWWGVSVEYFEAPTVGRVSGPTKLAPTVWQG